MTNSADLRLRQGYRVIRRVTGAGESPWPGELVCMPNGDMAVAVDSDVLGADWGGWDALEHGHVLGPVDLLRREGGHDVLLPVCTERVEEFLSRRGIDGADLAIGEGVTLAVSLLRGLAESEGACGVWWLTEAGRPVFATGAAEDPVEAASIALLAEIGRMHPQLDRALSEVIESTDDPRRLARARERAEASLFEIAAPLPLATTTFGPKRARAIAPPTPDSLGLEDGPARTPWPLSLARHIDADWSDLVSRTTTGLWRRVREREARGRRPWLVAACLAGAILAGGLLWPAGPGGPATADSSRFGDAAPSPSPSPGHTPAPLADDSSGEASPEAGAPTADPVIVDGDLAAIAAGLLTSRSACGEDSECLASVVESDAAAFAAGVVDLPADERTITLLDEFGGAAVLRAESVENAGTAQLVVIVLVDGRWLLGGIHDVAQQ